MRKLDLANEVRGKVGGFSKKSCSALIDLLLDTIKDALADGENVKISGFGSFLVRSKRERVGRNPHTGDELVIPARKVLTFKPSQLLRRSINRG